MPGFLSFAGSTEYWALSTKHSVPRTQDYVIRGIDCSCAALNVLDRLSGIWNYVNQVKAEIQRMRNRCGASALTLLLCDSAVWLVRSLCSAPCIHSRRDASQRFARLTTKDSASAIDMGFGVFGLSSYACRARLPDTTGL